MRPTLTFLACSVSLALAGAAVAQQDPLAAAIKARQAHMTLYSANLGVLGGMAQSRIEYDAEAAQAAADNLAALARLDQRGYWLEGTAAGTVEGTRALPAIWEDMDGFRHEMDELIEATGAMQQAASSGLEGLQGAMGGLGGVCGDCHENYRQTQ